MRDGYRCQLRYAGICTGVATEVDRADNTEDYTLNGSQSCCHACHLRKTSAEGNAAAALGPDEQSYEQPEPPQQPKIPRVIWYGPGMM